MNVITKHKSLLITVALVMLAGMWVYRLGSSDVTVVTDFRASYMRFDASMSELSAQVLTSAPVDPAAIDRAEQKADEALADLRTKAFARISSLTRNDGAMMNVAHELSEASSRELNALKAYKGAVTQKNSDSAGVARTGFVDFRTNEKAHLPVGGIWCRNRLTTQCSRPNGAASDVHDSRTHRC